MGLREERLQDGLHEAGGVLPGVLAGEALMALGLMYSTGRSVEADLVEAHKWFNIAVTRGCAEAAVLRAEVAGEMNSADIAAAQRKARDWMALH